MVNQGTFSVPPTNSAPAPAPAPVPAPAPAPNSKNFETTWLFALFLGGLGVDRFYLGKVITGILKLITAGGLGLWWLIDIILVLSGKTTTKDGQPLANPPQKKTGMTIATICVIVFFGSPFFLMFLLVFIQSVQHNAAMHP